MLAELRKINGNLDALRRELREELLPPAGALRADAADAGRPRGCPPLQLPLVPLPRRTKRLRADVEPFLALCRETWGEEQLWAAVKNQPHGRARQEGLAAEDAEEPFSSEQDPFSAGSRVRPRQAPSCSGSCAMSFQARTSRRSGVWGRLENSPFFCPTSV